MNDKADNPFLTVAEAAGYLRLKKRTLDNMRAAFEDADFQSSIHINPLKAEDFSNECPTRLRGKKRTRCDVT